MLSQEKDNYFTDKFTQNLLNPYHIYGILIHGCLLGKICQQNSQGIRNSNRIISIGKFRTNKGLVEYLV